MTLAELCEAAITLSDNTAGNLLLANYRRAGGLTAFVRTLGDTVTRLDRIETELNEALPGDPRDTTTPAAMAAEPAQLVLGDALSAKSRAQLKAWLVANKTGDTRLRAGVPAGWIVGDKTGTGGHGTQQRRRHDLAARPRAAHRLGLSHRKRGFDRSAQRRDRGSGKAVAASAARSRKNATTSRASASGCSSAAKCPPFGMRVQRRMSV